MDVKQLTENLAVTGQVRPEDIEAVKAAGFRSLVCNRPDGEEPDQPAWSEVAAAAEDAGLETRFIPIASADDIAASKDEFASALEELPGPVLAFCRTGNRSGMLYQASQG